ncbi:MAG: shikimate kinase [Acidobacteriota bacterium]|nr:MAG: shikimate kinase [Acidobacteriota bacterium]
MPHGRTSKKNIYLTGFMASGKTTVGKRLAQRLGWRFHDVDSAIEHRARKPIAKIFSSKGEAAFRKMEELEIQRAARKRRTVIALGGGALASERNRHAVEESGLLIYLCVSPAEALRRIENDGIENRPMLRGVPPAKRKNYLAALLSKRRPLYRRASIRVATGGSTPRQIVERILRKLLWDGIAPPQSKSSRPRQ